MVHALIESRKSASYVVTDVAIWLKSGVKRGQSVVVQNGRVMSMGDADNTSIPQGIEALRGNGLVLMPAGVDAQVHLRVPGQPQKETAESGLWAAVHGGVGALLTMPNTKPVIDHPDVCRLAVSELEPWVKNTGVRVLLSGAITVGQRGKELTDFDGLSRAGVVAFTDDGVGVASDDLMRAALQAAARVGKPILQHAEVPGHGAVLAEGPVQKKIGGPAYPVSAETDMVRRDLSLLGEVRDARYHVLHVSASATLAMVQEARRKGLRVSAEVSPHHLFFSSSDIHEEESSFKMNPPLRGPLDREGLQKALASGVCDFIATDHAPHERDVKTENFKTSAFGTTGMETSLRVLLWMYQRGQLTPERLVEVWASAPAKFLGVDEEFGDIAVGRPMNAVLVDVEAEDQLVTNDDFVGLSKNSCFKGSHLPGRLHATLLGEHVHMILG